MLGKRVINLKDSKLGQILYMQIRLVFTDSLTYILCNMSEHFIKNNVMRTGPTVTCVPICDAL